MATDMRKIGAWAFLAGLLLVLVHGYQNALLGATGDVLIVLIGVIVGVLNISRSETNKTLLAGVVFALAGVGFVAASLGQVAPGFEGILFALGTYFLSVVLVAAVKVIFFASRN